MLKVNKELKIYLYNKSIDFRKAINGLSALVVCELNLNPQDGSVYIFCNKSRNKVKILFYDRNGFVMYYKCLERKKFAINFNSECALISVEQLDWLLAGLDFNATHEFPEIKYSHFY